MHDCRCLSRMSYLCLPAARRGAACTCHAHAHPRMGARTHCKQAYVHSHCPPPSPHSPRPLARGLLLVLLLLAQVKDYDRKRAKGERAAEAEEWLEAEALYIAALHVRRGGGWPWQVGRIARVGGGGDGVTTFGRRGACGCACMSLGVYTVPAHPCPIARRHGTHH